MLKLIIEDDEGRKTTVPFVRDELTIGRQEGNTIRLTERNVSRRHARLVRANGHIVLEDLGSANGCRVNGDRIAGPVQLSQGDLIQIGDYDLALEQEDDNATPPGPLEPVALRPELSATMPGVADAEEVVDPADESKVSSPTPAPTSASLLTTAVVRMDKVSGRGTQRPVVDLEPGAQPRLVVLNTELAGREHQCKRTEVRIGRTDENDFALDHRSLSRAHCKVVREASGEWKVVDLQSANGLMVNGEAYAEVALRDGDILELGHVKLRFVGPGQSFRLQPAVTEPELPARGTPAPRSSPPARRSPPPRRAPSSAASRGSRTGLYAGLGLLGVVALGAVAYFGLSALQPAEPVVARPKRPPRPVGEAQEGEARPAAQADEAAAALLAQAQQALQALDFEKAEQALESCRTQPTGCPGADALAAQVTLEKGARAALDDAERRLAGGDAAGALAALGPAAATSLQKERLGQVQRAAESARAAPPPAPTPVAAAPAPTHSPARPVEAVPPPAVAPAARAHKPEAEKAYQEGVRLVKAGEYGAARKVLNQCVAVEPTYAECYLERGKAEGKLEEAEAQRESYRKFLKFAPEHRLAEKIRAMLAQDQ